VLERAVIEAVSSVEEIHVDAIVSWQGVEGRECALVPYVS
jgi:hypothetical protein